MCQRQLLVTLPRRFLMPWVPKPMSSMPSRTAPTSTKMLVPRTSKGWQQLVKDNGLDVGFAYDGDADRCLCVDEQGRVVDGDAILYIYSKYMQERGKLIPNTVVTTVMSNFGLYKAFDEAGIRLCQDCRGR